MRTKTRAELHITIRDCGAYGGPTGYFEARCSEMSLIVTHQTVPEALARLSFLMWKVSKSTPEPFESLEPYRDESCWRKEPGTPGEEAG